MSADKPTAVSRGGVEIRVEENLGSPTHPFHIRATDPDRDYLWLFAKEAGWDLIDAIREVVGERPEPRTETVHEFVARLPLGTRFGYGLARYMKVTPTHILVERDLMVAPFDSWWTPAEENIYAVLDEGGHDE